MAGLHRGRGRVVVVAEALKRLAARMRAPRDERGADSLEQVWAFTFTILIGFALISLIVAGFTGVGLATSVEEAAMKADFSKAVVATDVKAAVADEIARNSSTLKREDIEVTSASVEFKQASDSAAVPPKGTGVSRIDSDETTATLTCDVTCKAPTLLSVWGLGDIKVTRSIKTEVPLTRRLEVS